MPLPFLRDRIRLTNRTSKVIRLRFRGDTWRLEPGEHLVVGGGRISFSTQEVELVEVYDRKKRESDRAEIRRALGPWKE